MEPWAGGRRRSMAARRGGGDMNGAVPFSNAFSAALGGDTHRRRQRPGTGARARLARPPARRPRADAGRRAGIGRRVSNWALSSRGETRPAPCPHGTGRADAAPRRRCAIGFVPGPALGGPPLGHGA